MGRKADFTNPKFGGIINVAQDLIIPNDDYKILWLSENEASFTVTLRSTDLSAATDVTLKYGSDPDDKATFSTAKDAYDDDITFSVSGDGVTVTKTFYLNRYDYFYLSVASGSTGSITYKINVN